MSEKKYLMNVKVLYKGPLSKANEIGYLTLELLLNKKEYEGQNSKPLVETTNSYAVEGQRDVVPVSITRLNCTVSQIVKSENIKNGYDDGFRYSYDKGVSTFITRGINTHVEFGLPVPVED